MSEKLGIGASFPSLAIDLVDGQSLSLPTDLESDWKIILFYRGHW